MAGRAEASRMNDLEVERALLGAVLSGYPGFDELTETIFPIDFDSTQHERIWGACLAVSEAGNRVEPVAVRVAMGAEANKLPGGATYLADLMHSAPLVAAAPSYAAQVAAQAARRRLGQVASRLSVLSESTYSVEEITEQARAAIDEATEQRQKRRLVTAAEVMPEVLDIAQHGRARGIPSPWPDIDRFTSGLHAGRLVIVGARPGVGKSVMGTNLALSTARDQKRPVLICSMEMDAVEVQQRILAAHAGVNLSSLINGTMVPSSWDRVDACTQEVMAMPIHIEDQAGQTLSSIRGRLRDMMRAHEPASVVIVDYLQLMQPRDRRMNRAEQIGEISRGLKVIAREFGVCLIAMAQLNREAAKGARPGLADLRESGSIEADADVVLLLHRPDEQGSEVECLVEKNRSGPRGMTNLEMQGHYARLVQKSHAWREPA